MYPNHKIPNENPPASKAGYKNGFVVFTCPTNSAPTQCSCHMGKFPVPFCQLFIKLWLYQSHYLTFKMFTSNLWGLSSSIYPNYKIPNENLPAGKVGYKMDLLFSLVRQTRCLPNILDIWENLQFHLVNCSSNYDFTKITIWLLKCLLVGLAPSIQTIRFLMRTHRLANSAPTWYSCRMGKFTVPFCQLHLTKTLKCLQPFLFPKIPRTAKTIKNFGKSCVNQTSML